MKKYILKNKWLFFLATFFMCLYTAGQVGVAYIVKSITDAISLQDKDLLIKVFILSLIYLIFLTLIGILSKKISLNYIRFTISNFRQDMFDKLLKLNIRTFNKKNSAEYISLLNNDVRFIEECYFNNLINIVTSIVQLTIAILAICLINPILALLTITINFLPMLIPLILSKQINSLREKYSNELSIYTQKLKDFCTGFEVIKSFNIESQVSDTHYNNNLQIENSKYNLKFLEGISYYLATFSGLFVFTSIFAISGYFVIRDSLKLGTVLAIVQLLNYIVGPIENLSSQISSLKSVKGIQKKFDSIVVSNQYEILEVNKTNFENTISIKDLSFSFGEDKLALNKINFIIEKGKKYAIVGKSGSGKSTLVKLLLKYYDNYDGSIDIDGLNISKISLNQLYEIVSVIHQNVFMFDDTILNNISLYKEYDKKTILEAAKKSGLGEFLKQLPNGLDTHIEDNGKNFSGGEKQRFAIARALVKQTPILILDEATSSLDNETAYDIEKSILNIEEITTIVITHKLYSEMMKQYDQIIVLNDGAICELGTFDELISKKGHFYSLYTVFN